MDALKAGRSTLQLVAIVATALLALAGIGWAAVKWQDRGESGQAGVAKGETGVLASDNRDAAAVALTLADHEAASRLLEARDFPSLGAMSEAGRLVIVPPGVRVLVLAVDGDAARVRVLDGERAGHEGWTNRRWVRPAP